MTPPTHKLQSPPAPQLALAAELARRLGSRLVLVRLAPCPVIVVPGPDGPARRRLAPDLGTRLRRDPEAHEDERQRAAA